MRRGVDMVYIVENNGVYGLTKGQFSATSDRGSKSKKGVENPDSPIDLAALAVQLGATFVARSFSGDKDQLVPLIKAAFEHRGAAFIDVISPCVAFNNHDGSTKSFDYVRAHNSALNTLDFISRPCADRDRLSRRAHPRPSRCTTARAIRLHKLADDHDFTDRSAALAALEHRRAKGEIVTGLIYLNEEAVDLHDAPRTRRRRRSTRSTDADLCPGSKALEAINAGLR